MYDPVLRRERPGCLLHYSLLADRHLGNGREGGLLVGLSAVVMEDREARRALSDREHARRHLLVLAVRQREFGAHEGRIREGPIEPLRGAALQRLEIQALLHRAREEALNALDEGLPQIV